LRVWAGEQNQAHDQRRERSAQPPVLSAQTAPAGRPSLTASGAVDLVDLSRDFDCPGEHLVELLLDRRSRSKRPWVDVVVVD
jgi:hypothetical protein